MSSYQVLDLVLKAGGFFFFFCRFLFFLFIFPLKIISIQIHTQLFFQLL